MHKIIKTDSANIYYTCVYRHIHTYIDIYVVIIIKEKEAVINLRVGAWERVEGGQLGEARGKMGMWGEHDVSLFQLKTYFKKTTKYSLHVT